MTEYFGTHTTPEVSIGRLVRIAIALPVFIESVEVRGHLYVDGGLIELLPTQPAIEHGPFDHVFGINFMLPEGLEPDDITGWHEKPMGIVRASRELQQAYQVEFARRARRELGDALTIIDAADPSLCRGAWLYDLFIDRSRWPELIRTGYERTTRALAPMRRRATRSNGSEGRRHRWLLRPAAGSPLAWRSDRSGNPPSRPSGRARRPMKTTATTAPTIRPGPRAHRNKRRICARSSPRGPITARAGARRACEIVRG